MTPPPSSPPPLSAVQQLHRAGKLPDAEREYGRLLGADPSNVAALRGLALLFRQTGRDAEAVPLLEKAAAAKPADPGIHGELGVALDAVGRHDDAIKSLFRVVALDPSNPWGHFHLGRAYVARFEPGKAVKHLGKALELNPRHPEFHRALGTALLHGGNASAAIPHFKAALQAVPDNAELLCMLGTAHATVGEVTTALECFDAALKVRPNFPQAISGIAHAQESAGRFEEAESLLARALGEGVEDATLAVAFARIAKRLDRQEDVRAMLGRILDRRDLPRRQRVDALMALGQTLDGLKRYDEAFEAFRQSHALYARTFDAAAHERATTELIEAFSPDALRRLPRASIHDERPVFIVGMPRSGTTLVEQILSSHPMAFGAGELPHIERIVLDLPRTLGSSEPYPRCIRDAKAPAIDAVARPHLDRLASLAPHAARISDKMPHNFRHLGPISLIFPGARIISCARDPMDNCVSCYMTGLNPRHDYVHNLPDLAAFYLQHLRLMSHWKAVLDVPILEVPYERMVAEQESMTRRLIEFAGLPWDDRCLRFHENERIVTTASRDQVNRPIYTSSLNRWKKFEAHLDELKQGLAPILDRPQGAPTP